MKRFSVPTIVVTIVVATSIHVPKALLQAVDRRARALRVSRNQLVRQALEHEVRGGLDWSPTFFDRLLAVEPTTASDVDDLLTAVVRARRSKSPTKL